MNNERRKQLREVISQLESLNNKLQRIMDDEEMAFDNLPEGLQSSMKGGAMEEAIANIEAAMESIEEGIMSVEEAAQ
jgi:exonuclease VII small subunit